MEVVGTWSEETRNLRLCKERTDDLEYKSGVKKKACRFQFVRVGVEG